MDVKELFSKDYIGSEVTLFGWIRNHRKQKEYGFIDFSDGTCFKHVQLVYDNNLKDFDVCISINKNFENYSGYYDKVSEIKIDFDSEVFYFSNVFKKQMKLSPMSYRKKCVRI